MLTALAALLLTSSTPAVSAAPFDAARASRTDHSGHERLLLLPTEDTLPARTIAVGSDELVWLRATVGVTDRLQLSLSGLAIPFPFAGGLIVPLRGIVGAGAAGVGLAGAWSMGAKYRLLDEGSALPAITVGYDLIDGFIAGAGVGGVAAVGDGALGGVLPAIGLVNGQLNVLSVAAGKHLGPVHAVGGVLVLDNHNILPQSAGVAGAFLGVGTGGAGAAPVGQSQQFNHLPTQVLPYVGAEWTLGPRASLIAEGVIRKPSGPFASMGARWLLRDRGAVRMRLDAGAVWTYFPEIPGDAFTAPIPAVVLPEPYISMAVYVG